MVVRVEGRELSMAPPFGRLGLTRRVSDDWD